MEPTDTVKLTIDGREITTPPGQTLLAVARAHAIDIPTLCHDPRLPAHGACQLCVVEVDGAPRLALACATEAKADMKVQTRSARVVAARRTVLELVFSNHDADCRGPCAERCPAGVDVHGYLALVGRGKLAEALALIREANPFPSVCGRVCVRYCELGCRRREVDESVAINFVKRYVTELTDLRLPVPTPCPERGPRIAVVGGGPAGLTAAYHLRQQGLGVTVFEAQPQLGGMLRYGIPDYRLPPAVLDRELDYLVAHGIAVQTGTRLGREITLDSLRAEGFAAILLALGATRAKPMGVAGEATVGVVGGIDFLERVKREGPPTLRGPVLVVGGGNTALDAARTALRCGASRVTVLYRRTREEMPAASDEVDDALAEGIDLQFLVAPLAVVAEHGHVKALRCQEMRLGEPDAGGRRRPVPVDGSAREFAANLVIAAIGQESELAGIVDAATGELTVSNRNTLVVDPVTLATNLPGVFAAGDVVSGPAAVVDAIAQGRRAARAIGSFVATGVAAVAPDELVSHRQAAGPAASTRELLPMARAVMPKQAPEDRVTCFGDVDLGLEPGQVAAEVGRCLACGCAAFYTCELRRYGSEYQARQQAFPGRVKRYKVDERHPFIALDPGKCILCGKCVRLCAELHPTAALGFLYRGFETLVRPTMERSLQEAGCESCGNCIDACPTGAIAFARACERPGTLATTAHPSVCNYCGVGCGLVVHKRDDQVWFVAARANADGAPGELCVRGRFGHRLGPEVTRLTAPLVRDHERLATTTVAAALERALAGLRRVAERHGPAALGFFLSPRATNEEIFLAARLARECFGSNNVGSFFHLTRRPDDPDLSDTVGGASSTVPLAALAAADLILTINTELTEAAPVLGFQVQRARRRGARLLSVAGTPNRLSGLNHERVAARRGTTTALLRAVTRVIVERGRQDTTFIRERTEGYEPFARELLGSTNDATATTGVSAEVIEAMAMAVSEPATNLVIVYDDDDEREKAPADLQAVINLLLVTGRLGRPANGLILARHHANGQGFVDLGGLPEPRQPGLAGAASIGELAELFATRRLKGLFVVGEDPAADPRLAPLVEAAEHVVVADLVATETTWRAQVVLPWTTYLEAAGSVTSVDRRVQAFAPVFAPPAGLSGFELLSRCYGLASGRAAPGLAEVRRAIATARPGYAGLVGLADGGSCFAHGGPGEGGRLYPERFLTPSGRARFRPTPAVGRVPAAQPRSYSTLDLLLDEQLRRLAIDVRRRGRAERVTARAG